MSALIVPEKLINFMVYLENSAMVGIADAQLPSLEAMSETIKGAGIAGEVESPTLGHFAKMTLGLTFRSITTDATSLAQQKIHAIELRGAQQVFNPLSGTYESLPVKVTLRCSPKKVDLGKLTVGAQTDTKHEFEVIYIKVWLDDVEKIELDKFNFIYKVDGVDYLASVKKSLGLA